jgi:hypothetical protein
VAKQIVYRGSGVSWGAWAVNGCVLTALVWCPTVSGQLLVTQLLYGTLAERRWVTASSVTWQRLWGAHYAYRGSEVRAGGSGMAWGVVQVEVGGDGVVPLSRQRVSMNASPCSHVTPFAGL